MLGVERGKVLLVEYEEEWENLYNLERDKLVEIEGIEELSHIGSTAIKDIVSKPIIDMGFIYKGESDIENIISGIEELGYEYRGDAGVEGRLFFVRTEDELSLYHISGYKTGDENYTNLIRFRDYLNANEKYREEYGKLKLKLYNKYGDNREKYTLGKAIFIKFIIKKSIKDEKIQGDN